MNKKGHIGTLLLVFGALVLVVFALYSMISFNSDLSKKKAELRAISDKSESTHKFTLKFVSVMINDSLNESLSKGTVFGNNDFEVKFNESFRKLADAKRGGEINTNIYAKIALGDYSLVLNDGKYQLMIFDVFENYNSNNNEVRYSYSLKVIFDENRVYSLEEFMRS
ncbi:hypothetical protein FJZ21_02475 [Candidatus Pacearchaeota archaeon]|nr:hypothetical protein [Candidatus Pacearchaeota archaeon]